MEENYEIIPINGSPEAIKIYIDKFKDLDWNNTLMTNKFFKDYWEVVIPDSLITKKDLVKRLKIISEIKLFSEISFKEFYLNNK